MKRAPPPGRSVTSTRPWWALTCSDHEGQAQARPGGPGPPAGGRPAVEALEYGASLGRLDSRADVLHRHLGFVAAPVDPHAHRPAGVSPGVVEQVDEHPLQGGAGPPSSHVPLARGVTVTGTASWL